MSWNPKKRSIVYVISDANDYIPHPVHPLCFLLWISCFQWWLAVCLGKPCEKGVSLGGYGLNHETI